MEISVTKVECNQDEAPLTGGAFFLQTCLIHGLESLGKAPEKVHEILHISQGCELWKMSNQEPRQGIGFTRLRFFFEEPQP